MHAAGRRLASSEVAPDLRELFVHQPRDSGSQRLLWLELVGHQRKAVRKFAFAQTAIVGGLRYDNLMPTKPLQKIAEICLALPESKEERNGDHATYRVRKKVFAYYLDDHHGDGIVSICTKTRLGENFDLAKHDPERFYIPAYIGPRGWVGLRLDGPKIDWAEVRRLVTSSYRVAAPKSLTSRLE